MDWSALFVPQVPLWETVARGTVVYLSLYALLRIVFKRESGVTGVTDLLVIVLLADAAQNAMADDYRSITDGIILVMVILGWAFLLNLLTSRWRWAERIIRPRPLLLVKDGIILRQNLKRELLTVDELRSQLREQGIDDVRKVRRAYMEPDGRISAITGEADRRQGSSRRVF